MTADWYFVRSGHTQGPFTLEAMKAYVAAGEISPDDLVWRQGMAEWLPLSQCRDMGLAARSHSGPPPIPTKAPSATTTPTAPASKGSKLFRTAASMFNASTAWAAGKWTAMTLQGRWCNGRDLSDWIELLPNNVVRTPDDRAGQWTLVDSNKSITLTLPGEAPHQYLIVQASQFVLQLRSQDGVLIEYTRGRTGDQERAEAMLKGAVSGVARSVTSAVDVLTKPKCPSCGKHGGEKAGKEKITESLATAVAYRDGFGNVMKYGTTWQKFSQYVDMKSEDKQLGVDYTVGVVVVKTSRTQTTFRCSECSHEWQTESTKEQLIPATFRDPDEAEE